MTAAIDFACPYCERVSRVPVSYAGTRGKCPGCKKLIEVPEPEPGTAGAAEPAAAPDEGDGAAAAETKPCPYCGERIRAAARKCKFCGEFLDAGLRKQGRTGGGGRSSREPLASRGARLGAVMLNNLLWVPLWFLFGLGIFLVADRNEEVGAVLIVLSLALGLALLIYQGYLLSTTGQTLGKRWLGIRVVRLDGSPVDFACAVVLREGAMFVLNMIPYVNLVIGPVDALMIFGEEQRCLHDHIAGTKVVEA